MFLLTIYQTYSKAYLDSRIHGANSGVTEAWELPPLLGAPESFPLSASE